MRSSSRTTAGCRDKSSRTCWRFFNSTLPQMTSTSSSSPDHELRQVSEAPGAVALRPHQRKDGRPRRLAALRVERGGRDARENVPRGGKAIEVELEQFRFDPHIDSDP